MDSIVYFAGLIKEIELEIFWTMSRVVTMMMIIVKKLVLIRLYSDFIFFLFSIILFQECRKIKKTSNVKENTLLLLKRKKTKIKRLKKEESECEDRSVNIISVI